MRVVVLPEDGGSAAMMIDAPRSIPIQNMAAMPGDMFPAARISVIDIGVGGSQCHPHQLVGWLSARITE